MIRFLLAAVLAMSTLSTSALAATILENTFAQLATPGRITSAGGVDTTATIPAHADGQTVAAGINNSESFVTRVGYELVASGSNDQLIVGGLGCDIAPIISFNSFSGTPTAFASSHSQATCLEGRRPNTDYFQFHVALEDNHAIDFESFEYTSFLSPGTPASPPNVIEFRSSLDSFATVIGTSSITGTSISLTDAAYQNIRRDVQFRLYVQETTGAIDEAVTFSLDSFSFNGTVTAVPEPEGSLMIAFVLVAWVLRRRSRRASSCNNTPLMATA